MTEQQTPVVETKPEPKKKAPATHEQKQKRRKRVRRAVALAAAAAILITSTVLLKKFVFKDEEGLGEIMTAPVDLGSIQSMVEGSGTARAKNSASVTPDAGYRVLELFVAEGDTVTEGQLLYNLDDTAAQEGVRNAQEGILKAQEGVRKAQEVVDTYNRELAKLREDVAELSITAPHAGKLMEINRDIKAGKDLSAGEAVATVVNDTKLRLHLYYSWAYEGKISVGQSAQITLPGAMTAVPGTVEQVNYVKRIVPEGAVTFEVVFVLDNPGTLTEGMAASAALTAADGAPIYPYDSGALEYYETSKISVKIAGPVLEAHLMNYADVTAGQLLVRLGDKDLSADIDAKISSVHEAQKGVTEAQKGVDAAVKTLEEAQEKLDNYHAVAPISGRVLSCSLVNGEEVSAGAAIQIADTSTMLVDISIDERNIGYVSTGMMVDLQDQMGNYYMGTVEQVSLVAKAENGVAYFPATVAVDNSTGMLMTNAYINYSFVASQSNNCLVVPIQAVKNVTLSQPMDGEGGPGAIPGGEMGEVNMPTLPDGGEVAVPEGGLEGGVDIPEGGEVVPEGGVDAAEPAEDGEVTGGEAGAGEPADAVVPAADDVIVSDGSVSVSGGGVAVSGGAVVIPMAAAAEAPRAQFLASVMAMPEGGISIGGSSRGPGAFQDNGTATVCFVQGEPDERGIEADPSWEVPEGFFPVIVKTGLNDDTNVEIKSGLRQGDVVFVGYMTNNASMWG